MYGLEPVPFHDGGAVASMDRSTEYKVILLTSEGRKMRCKDSVGADQLPSKISRTRKGAPRLGRWPMNALSKTFPRRDR